VLGARHQRADPGPELRLAADGHGVERAAVGRVPHRDRLVAACRDARQLERSRVGGRATRGEQDAVEVARGERRQAARELDGRSVGVAPGGERERVELALDRLDHARVAEPDLLD
jgi:hypothetical protein